MLSWVDRLFEKHKAARRIALFWSLALISYATHAMFSDIGAISAPSATAYATVVSLLTAVVAFYQWSRTRDDLDRG